MCEHTVNSIRLVANSGTHFHFSLDFHPFDALRLILDGSCVVLSPSAIPFSGTLIFHMHSKSTIQAQCMFALLINFLLVFACFAPRSPSFRTFDQCLVMSSKIQIMQCIGMKCSHVIEAILHSLAFLSRTQLPFGCDFRRVPFTLVDVSSTWIKNKRLVIFLSVRKFARAAMLALKTGI